MEEAEVWTQAEAETGRGPGVRVNLMNWGGDPGGLRPFILRERHHYLEKSAKTAIISSFSLSFKMEKCRLN